jgi:hypothetical protein
LARTSRPGETEVEVGAGTELLGVVAVLDRVVLDAVVLVLDRVDEVGLDVDVDEDDGDDVAGRHCE